jgi:hypothetical protein
MPDAPRGARLGVFDGATRPRPVWQMVAAGVTRARLRGPGYQQTSRGFYVPAGVDLSEARQRVLGAAVRTPPGGAVGGWGAARALGVVLCDGLALDGRTLLDVPVVTGGRDVRRTPGIDVWTDALADGDVVDVDGVCVTAPLRTCFDGVRRSAELVEAVVFADLMLHAELVDLPGMRAYIDDHAGWRGVQQARRALDLADPLARNGWETRLRMVWLLEARLPRPLCNPPVFDLQGRLLGYPDLLDPDAGTVGEYDGGGHRRLGQHARDNVREELFEDHGLVVTRATSVDFGDTTALATRMRRAHARGLRRDRRRDRWTLEVPPHWGAMGASVRELLDEQDRGWTPPF